MKGGFVLAWFVDRYVRGNTASTVSMGYCKDSDVLPIYIFSGDDDPLHGERQDLDRMITAYQDRGISNIEHRFTAMAGMRCLMKSMGVCYGRPY